MISVIGLSLLAAGLGGLPDNTLLILSVSIVSKSAVASIAIVEILEGLIVLFDLE